MRSQLTYEIVDKDGEVVESASPIIFDKNSKASLSKIIKANTWLDEIVQHSDGESITIIIKDEE